MTSHLVRTIVLLAKLNNLINDKFFYNKFENKIKDLLLNFILILNRSGDDVAQYQIAYEKTIKNLNNVLEVLEDLKYLNFIEPSPLFFQIQKNLLILKLELIKGRQFSSELKIKKVESNIQEEKIKKVVSENIVNKNLKLNQSKKKILEFIRSYPNIRTKDIISEFNALSDRTVKRNLTDLLHTGLIRRKVDNKAVYYYPSE